MKIDHKKTMNNEERNLSNLYKKAGRRKLDTTTKSCIFVVLGVIMKVILHGGKVELQERVTHYPVSCLLLL